MRLGHLRCFDESRIERLSLLPPAVHEKWVAVLPERAFYLLFGPLVGAAVGAGTMAYMDRSNHG